MKKIILYLFLSTLLFSNSLKVNNKNFFINNRIIYFNNFINNLNKIKDEKIIVKKVNIFVNKFKYKSDFSNYNKKDYWQTPHEMLIKDSGDCEDFALMKYMILKKNY
jgi:predicted transglutaminase-like cysteine proteinase